MSLYTPLIWISFMLPLIAIAFAKTKKVNSKFLILFIVYFLADCYIQHFSRQYVSLDSIGLKFSWVGKILSLLLALTIIFSVSKTHREQIGFTSKSNTKKQVRFGIFLFLGFLLFDLIFKLILFPKGGHFNLETFAFQATMPGLTEELVFRGICFWLLDQAFTPQWNIKGISLGWGFVIVTLLFSVAHGVVLTKDHQLKFDIITIIYLTLISSLSVGLLRKFSGNLVYPVIGHNMINVLNALIRIL
ncbi:CPBP family intramembrane metalloprotease [Sphingobacterium sp. PCS056]|uniref:CPBP family glutamic-type intramembrane protease n=1 Tax=Sphingobacterium sp. PCS056 TaxID=2931400 RepID=UPI00200E94EC|nr:CPBP family glutamic-type intramembrane protease [Sphingobacterium sp. PCS056]UPZ36393.1 CPBP family intramembrane metalloprotease [Sphingobacterium sp. PCS056]